MKNLNIAILYKNQKYKIISFKKIKLKDLIKDDIKMILIPLYDNLNTFIPIKSSILNNFSKVSVQIIYQSFIFDYEDGEPISFAPHVFENTCNDIIEFINTIYCIYKFRGGGMYIEDNNKMDLPLSCVIFPRKITIKFYNENNQIFEEINSGDMGDLRDYKIKRFRQTPPGYLLEDRFMCLKDIFFIPTKIKGNVIDLETIPYQISLNDNSEWNNIKKISKELNKTDMILYRIRDFEVYYLLDYNLFNNLVSFNPFDIVFITSPICNKYDRDILKSLDENKIPTFTEKMEAISAYECGDIFNMINVVVSIYTIDDFLQSLVFLKTIMDQLIFITKYSYYAENSDFKMRSFIILNRLPNGVSKLLTSLELQNENIADTFIKISRKD